MRFLLLLSLVACADQSSSTATPTTSSSPTTSGASTGAPSGTPPLSTGTSVGTSSGTTSGTTSTTPQTICAQALVTTGFLDSVQVAGNGLVLMCHWDPNAGAHVEQNVALASCLTHVGHNLDIFPTTICGD